MFRAYESVPGSGDYMQANKDTWDKAIEKLVATIKNDRIERAVEQWSKRA